MSSKSIRSWVASLLFLLMVLLILSFLAQRQIPEKNKDIIVSIIGMIVGSMSMAISILSAATLMTSLNSGRSWRA